MISQRREYAQVQIAPRFRLGLKHRIVVCDAARQRYIAIHDQSGGALPGNLAHQPLANSRVGLPVVFRIGEPLVSVGDERHRIGQLVAVNPERGAELAQEVIRSKSGRCGGLRDERNRSGSKQKRKTNRGFHDQKSHMNMKTAWHHLKESAASFAGRRHNSHVLRPSEIIVRYLCGCFPARLLPIRGRTCTFH